MFDSVMLLLTRIPALTVKSDLVAMSSLPSVWQTYEWRDLAFLFIYYLLLNKSSIEEVEVLVCIGRTLVNIQRYGIICGQCYVEST